MSKVILLSKKNVIRMKLLENGVKNLQEFGYEKVNTENILTDEVYSAFFESMLKQNKGQRADVDEVINNLLNQIKPQ